MTELPRQPAGQFQIFAKGVQKTEDGFVPMMIDPSRGAMLKLIAEKPTLHERITQGGIVGAIILFLGLFGMLIACYKYVQLSFIGRQIKRQLRNLETPKNNNPLGRVLTVVKDSSHLNLEALELSLDEAILKEMPALERGQAFIKLLAVVAPLLGLLGTVIGMIITFQAITLFGTGDPKLMADGISQALVTTALGLITAIPLLFSHSVVATRSKSIVQILDQQSAGLIAGIFEKTGAAGN